MPTLYAAAVGRIYYMQRLPVAQLKASRLYCHVWEAIGVRGRQGGTEPTYIYGVNVESVCFVSGLWSFRRLDTFFEVTLF